MKKEIIKKAIYFIISYFKVFLLGKIKEAFFKSKDYFISLLWNEIKEDVKGHIKDIAENVESFFKSEEYEFKERIITDALFEKVKLPLLLRPTKPLLKNIIKNEIKKFVGNYLKSIKNKLNTII